MAAGTEAATRFLSFVNASPTPFHAVYNASKILEKAGFRKVSVQLEWTDDPTLAHLALVLD